MSITEVATTMRTRSDGEDGRRGDDIRLGVVRFLPAKERFNVFNAAQDEDGNGTNGADNKHAFETPHQHDDDFETHKHTMLFEMRALDQFGISG